MLFSLLICKAQCVCSAQEWRSSTAPAVSIGMGMPGARGEHACGAPPTAGATARAQANALECEQRGVPLEQHEHKAGHEARQGRVRGGATYSKMRCCRPSLVAPLERAGSVTRCPSSKGSWGARLFAAAATLALALGGYLRIACPIGRLPALFLPCHLLLWGLV